MNPLVSIIIPNYNHVQFLDQRLNTVLNQSYKNIEVILLDDASNDGSQDVLVQYKNHPLISKIDFNSTNSGSPFKQWQKGIALAKGDYIWIAESDDYCEQDFLAECMNKLSHNVEVCYTQSTDVDFQNRPLFDRLNYTNQFKPNIWHKSFDMDGNEFIKNYLLVKNVIPNASAVVFKKKLITPDVFDEKLLNMSMCGDWFFWVKVIYNTKIGFINKNLNYFRVHEKVSRVHDSNLKIKNRLIEESTIRQFVFINFKWINSIYTKSMYSKWYKLHAMVDFMKPDFYSIRFTSRMVFVFNFFLHKLKLSI